ncbi:Alpha/Beta hydrolase protein, partial [Mycena pura]
PIATPVVGAGPVVNLGYATYEGAVDPALNITTFLGIRYAAPAIGNLRFRAPQPPAPVSGVQEAKTQPDQCWQTLVNGLATTNPYRANPLNAREVSDVSSEDCLFLSVYYPSDAVGVPVGGLPTVVWIHTGGHVLYLWGSSSQYRGTDLIKQSNRGIVVVTIQYRLGLFGFLAGSAIKNNGTLNAGLLDQEFALRWVNKHISKFGGDPSKVTIWGQSAGAGSVLQHVIANNGQTKPQLFRTAMTSSTFVPSQYHYNERIPELIYSQVVAQTNCTSAADSLACLRTADVAALQNANAQISRSAFFETYTFAPVVDGEFIAQRPTQALAQGKVNGETLLSVLTAREGDIFVNASVPASGNVKQYALELFPNLGTAQAEKVGELYADVGAPLDQSAAVVGETILVCPTYSLLHAFSGRAFTAKFAVPPGHHSMDLQYYFPSFAIADPAFGFPTFFNDTAFINAFAQSFTAFAMSGDPNDKLSDTVTPRWETWDRVGRVEMVFGKTAGDKPHIYPARTEHALLERC